MSTGLCRGLAAGIMLATAALALAAAAPSEAHPLGNFSVNHQTRIQISRDRVALLYILDQAEIPTFQERRLSRDEIVSRKLDEVRRDLWVIVNGRRVTLRPELSPELTFPPGQGGLRITRLEIPFYVRVDGPRTVEVQDRTFGDRVGWVDMVSLPGRGTAVSTYVSPSDPTRGLRRYQGIKLADVADQVRGTFRVRPTGRRTGRPGKGSLHDLSTGATYGSPPPTGEQKGRLTGPPNGRQRGGAASETTSSGRGEEDGFASVFERAAQGEGVFLLMLLAAFAWGALHAVSPGHGKGMVAAYLVGTRGTSRHAVALGAIVTVTHTIGVFALGLVTLLLAQYILPEDLYPWLNLAAGLMIVAVGAGVLRSRLRWRRSHRAGPPPGPDHHQHDHHHGHSHAQADEESHAHQHSPDPTWKGLAGMGISAGIIPCPTALVVLLAAISQHQVGLGLLLIVVFSLGLAAALTAVGLLVVHANRLLTRAGSPLSLSGRLASALPAASTLVILGLGIVLTAKAVPDVV